MAKLKSNEIKELIILDIASRMDIWEFEYNRRKEIKDADLIDPDSMDMGPLEYDHTTIRLMFTDALDYKKQELENEYNPAFKKNGKPDLYNCTREYKRKDKASGNWKRKFSCLKLHDFDVIVTTNPADDKILDIFYLCKEDPNDIIQDDGDWYMPKTRVEVATDVGDGSMALVGVEKWTKKHIEEAIKNPIEGKRFRLLEPINEG